MVGQADHAEARAGRRLYRILAALMLAAAFFLGLGALLRPDPALAGSFPSLGLPGSDGAQGVGVSSVALSAPVSGGAGHGQRLGPLADLPRVQCVDGYTASIYAEGLSSPDGLAFSPSGVLHVAEEAAGRVSQIGPSGLVTPLMTGLQYPEGIAFDDAGSL